MTRPRPWMLCVAVLSVVGMLGGLLAWVRHDPQPPPRFTISVREGELVYGFAADSRSFVTQYQTATTLWDTTNGQPTRLPTTTPTSWLTMFVRASTRDRQRLAGWSVADQAVVWGDTATEEVQGKFPLALSEPTMLPHLGWVDGDRSIQLVTYDGSRPPQTLEIYIWNVDSGKEIRRTLALPAGMFHAPIAYSSDGRTWVYLTSNRQALQFWDAAIDVAIGGPLPLANVRPGSTATRYTIARFTHDGQTLIIGRDDGQVEVWNVITRRLLRTVRIFPRDQIVQSLAVSPDDQTLAACGAIPDSNTWLDRIKAQIRPWFTGPTHLWPIPTLLLIDLKTDQPLARYPATGFHTFSPDGKLFSTYDSRPHFSVRDVPRPAGR